MGGLARFSYTLLFFLPHACKEAVSVWKQAVYSPSDSLLQPMVKIYLQAEDINLYREDLHLHLEYIHLQPEDNLSS